MSEQHVLEDDRRSLPRVSTTLRAKCFPGQADCVVADFNDRGARLRFDHAAPSAPRLIVVVWSTGLAFEAQTCWRTGSDVGVRFLRRCDFRSRVTAEFWAARAVWLKSRPKVRPRMLRKDAYTTNAAFITRAEPVRSTFAPMASLRRPED